MLLFYCRFSIKMKEVSNHQENPSIYFEAKLHNFFTCPQVNSNNYSIMDLDGMLTFKHYLNGWVFLFVTIV